MPEWDRLLRMAAQSTETFGLGYLGLDLVLDARLGPVFLEANARPGLAIQIANRRGLMPLLRAVDDAAPDALSIEARVELARSIQE